MKKKLLVLFIVVLVFALLFPVRGKSSDGGSISYRAVLYEVKQVHRQELGPYGEPSRLTRLRKKPRRTLSPRKTPCKMV